MNRLFRCRFCDGTRLLRWDNGTGNDFVCQHCEDDELQQLRESKPFAEAPFKVRMTKLKDGRWSAGHNNTFCIYADETPEGAFYGLMKMLGWHWEDRYREDRWIRWITS